MFYFLNKRAYENSIGLMLFFFDVNIMIFIFESKVKKILPRYILDGGIFEVYFLKLMEFWSW